MAYSDKVLDHYTHPRNVGTMDKSSDEVGTGLVGAPECGDVMKLQIRVNPETNIIEDAKFKTFGCGSAIASSSLATEWVKGKTVDEALQIRNTDIVKELSLPPVKIHCSVLAEDAIRAAISDWKKKQERDEAGGRRAKQLEQTGVLPAEQLTASANGCDIGLQHDRHATRPKESRSRRRHWHIRAAIAKEGISPGEGGLRLGVQGGGCSGLCYNIRFDTQPRERDRIFQYGDVRVFVDPKSFIYLNGMTLD